VALLLRFSFLTSFTAMLTFAGSWSGFLVDADCYASHQMNTRAGTHPATVDTNRIVKTCPPKAESTSFVVMEKGGRVFNLDAAGNQKAHELVQKAGSAPTYKIKVLGDVEENTLKVSAISMGK
jgi:hypothetical protein